jgi:glycosyltransferase involved in cell wall biosynthesis
MERGGGALTEMPLRVLLDVRHSRDFGIGTYIRNLVAAFAKIDAEDRFIIIGRPGDLAEFGKLPENFQMVEYRRSGDELWDQVAFPWFARSFSPDLYHIPLNAVSPLMPKPYVVTIHDMSVLMFSDPTQRRPRLLDYRFRKGLERADRVIAVSSATRRDVEKLLGIPPQRIRQIYNAPDPRFLVPQAADGETNARILQRYGIEYPYVLYAGNIRIQKNIPRLVEAFAVVRGELESHPAYRDLRLIIIGDEIAKNPAVRRAIFQTRVEQAVRFLGFVTLETLRVFYEAAAAFVFPSLYEGFGLPPLEAMACGTPVVTSGVSSLPEVVGDAAMLVNPENVFDIARGIREVLLDERLRQRMIERGRLQVKRFSWERTAAEVLDVYRDVAGRRN